MVVSTTTLKMLKVGYWVILSVAQLYISYALVTSERTIAGVLWFVLGFMLIYIMYLVYFPAGDSDTKWPPYIAACPDYLTLLAPNACVDYVGLHSPILKKSDPAVPPSPTDPSHVFDASGSLAQKVARTNQYGLTWEGIV
jgi:hypothetical protein